MAQLTFRRGANIRKAFLIDDVEVTATAAELNILDTVTATAAELNVLADVTAGTVTAGKAIVTTTGKHIDALVISDSGLALGTGAGTVVTATAAEINAAADITTAGVAEASKGVLLDADKSVTGLGRMAQGAQANVSGSGPALSAAYPGTLRVFSDDGGANIADSVRGAQSRVLLTIDQSGGTIRALQGQLKALTGIDVTTGIYTAVQGYLELAATHSAKTGSTLSCFDASAEIGTALTVDSGGEFFGVHVETTGAGTITNNGTAAAIGVTKASGAASWPVGLFVSPLAVIQAIGVGTQANTSGSGQVLSASAAGALRVFADDGGANVGDSVRGIQSRTLLTVDQSAGTIRALQGQLKLATLVDVTTGIYTGVQGYVEMTDTHIAKTGSTFSCVDASAEIGTALTVDSGGEFFGVHIETTGAGTLTNNGTAAAVGVTIASGAAKWPVGLYNQVGAVTADVKVQAEDAASLPCMIFSGAAANDGDIVTAVGADTLWADGSLYISVVDGAGKLFQKQADIWVDMQV